MLIEYGCMAQFAAGAGTTVGSTSGGFIGGVLFGIAGALGAQQAPQMAAHMNNVFALMVALVPAAVGGCGSATKARATVKTTPTKGFVGGTCPRIPGNSFAPGTVVFTARGLRVIEQLEVGDIVAAWNPETKRHDWKPVTAKSSRQTEAVYKLTVRAEDGREETVRVTGNHPYLRAANDNTPVIAAGAEGAGQPATKAAANAEVHIVPMAPGGDWTAAGFLKPGDQIRSVENGTLTVTANELDPTATRVYTLTVADSHTYAVGELGAWVHNAKGGFVTYTLRNAKNEVYHGSGAIGRQSRKRRHWNRENPCEPPLMLENLTFHNTKLIAKRDEQRRINGSLKNPLDTLINIELKAK
jgi:Pretoxin HINT domain